MNHAPRRLSLTFALLLGSASLAACGGSESSASPDAGAVDSGPQNIGPTQVDATVISQSTSTMVEAESHVVAANNGFVVVAYNAVQQTGGGKIGYRFSTDGAANWEPPTSLASPNGGEASDPVLTVDSFDNVYLTFIGFKVDMYGRTSDMHVYVAIAPAGTTRFSQVVDVASGAEFDKPWITTMPDDALVVTYAKTSTGGVYAARSTDGGHTWKSAKVFEDGTSFNNLAFPCHPAEGNRLYVVFVGGSAIEMRFSDDGGATWPAANKLAISASSESFAFEDPTCAAQGDHLWVTYGLSTDAMAPDASNSQKLTAIRLAHSADAGKTLGGRYSAQDGQAARYFQHPYLAVEDGGALDLVYYAGNSDGDTSGSFRWSRSTNGGQSFDPSVPVQTKVTFLTARDSPKWLGDYPGLWLRAGELFTSFVANSGDYAHTGFAKLPLP